MTSTETAPKKGRRRDIAALRKHLDQRAGSLKAERQSGGWDQEGMEIASYLFPGGGRYYTHERNKAGANTQALILNCMASQALGILGAGLMSGTSSPARPWFKYGMQDPDLDAFQPVQLWLQIATETARGILQTCSIYRALASQYLEIPAFGTGCMIILPHPRDPRKIVHPYHVTAGEYSLGANFEGEVDTMYREFEMSVGALVKRFGKDNVSQTVKNLWDRGNYESGVPIGHAIEPRPDRDPIEPEAANLRDSTKEDALNQPWRSVYWEPGNNKDTILSESGHRRFPVLAPRWGVLGCDTYGRGPGRQCLPDVKTLQQKELRLAQGIDYQSQGPLGAPSSMEGREIDMLPGGVTFYDAIGPQNRIHPIYQAEHLRLADLHASIAKTEELINRSFHVDVFRMINDKGKDMTVPEVMALLEEKMQVLGPMLEHLQDELHEPLLEMVFEGMMTGGLLPPAPPEIQEQDYKVEFVGQLAQALRAIASQPTDRMVSAALQVAEFVPEVMDNFDSDSWFESKIVALGADPKIQRRKEARDALRAARAKAQAAKEQAEVMAVQAKAARDMAASPTAGAPNALTDANQVMAQYTGYGSALPA